MAAGLWDDFWSCRLLAIWSSNGRRSWWQPAKRGGVWKQRTRGSRPLLRCTIHPWYAQLEEKGLRPAPAAGKRILLRRVTFDLIGLPPTPEEIENFLRDSSPDAFAKVVDRLLASPHYGERWARHWLDLMRYAETLGHEFDNDKLDAWRYRDYAIRAFNEDVPYNLFVEEHIAGDLLPRKRISRDGAQSESPLGTSFYWFGESTEFGNRFHQVARR